MKNYVSKRIISCIMCLCMLLSVFYSGPVFAQTSSRIIPVLNADFEMPMENGVIPGWTQIMGVGKLGSVTIDENFKKSGNASLKMTDNDSTVNFAVESNKYEVISGANYSVTTDVYIQSGSVQLQLRYYDINQKSVTGATYVNDPNFTTQPVGVWQKLAVSAKAPENAKYVTIVAATGKGAKGISYWDNFELTEDIITYSEPELGTYDTLQNPDFELPLADGKIQQWKKLYGTQNPILDDQIKYEGIYSLKLEDNNDNEETGVISNYINVTPSMLYSVTSMVYSVSSAVYANPEISIRFFDATNNLIDNYNGVLTKPGEVWKQISASAIAPDTAVKAAVVLYSGKENCGTFYFDKVGVKEELPPQPKLQVSNGGFEMPTVGTAIPGWKVIKGNAALSTAMVFNGENSLLVQHNSTEGTGVTVESDLIDVKEGETYLLTSNVFVETRGMEGFYIYVYDEAGNIVKSADGKDYHAYINALTPLGEWIFTENAFTVQPGGKKLKISLITSYKRTYKFYIDDVSLTKAVVNGGFEQEVVNGLVPGWKKFNDATDGSTFGVTDSVYASGSKSLYLESESGKYLNVINNLIDVQAGETYTALAKNFIDFGSADMYVRFFDSSDKYIGQQAWSIRNDITNSWFTNSVKFVVPENASKAGIMFAGSATKSFKYYVDDVKLLKGDHVVKEEIIPENSITKVGEDLGPQIRKATIMRGDIGKAGDGRDVIYAVVAGAPSVFTIIDIETEEVVKSMPMADTSGAWSVKVSNDGTVYLGAYNLGLLYRYIPETGELKNLGHPLSTKDSVLYPMDSGKDGKMYGGNYPSGSLYEYDPATNKFTDYGTMAFANSGERWTRVTVYDAENNKAYSGVGNQARLVEYDFATGIKRDLLPPQYNDIIAVYDLNLAGGKLFAKKEANNANEMFVIDVKSGNLVEVTNADTGEKSFDVPMFSRGVSPKSPVDNKIYYAGAGGILYEYNLDTDTIKSLGVSIDGAAIGYGFVELNEEGFPGYSLVGLSGNNGKMYKYNLQTGNVKIKDVNVPAEPVNIHDIIKGPDGRIYTSGYLQGNMGVHTPTTGESYYMSGIGQGEGMTVINNKIYIGAYPDAKIYEYDLDKPWNRDNSDKLNPKLLFSLYDNEDIPGYTFQDRPFGMAGSEDLNKLFVGTVPKNGLLGGALTVYDLTTQEKPQIYWNIVPEQSVISLAYKDGMVYGGTSIHGGQGGTPTAKEAVLFVWDVAKGDKVFETIPVPGKTAITSLHIGPDGNVWGFANGALFIFDPIERKIVYSKDEFPDAIGRWIDGSMETGTDGNIYATVGGRFFKVDASTKAVTVLATQARKLAQDDFGNFYIYTVPEGPYLYKYSDSNLVLKLTGAELSTDKTDLKVGEAAFAKLKGLLEKGRTTNELAGAQIKFNISDPEVVELNNTSFIAKKTGSVQISATVTLDGVTVETNPVSIKVLDNSTGTGDTGSGGSNTVPVTPPVNIVKDDGTVQIDIANVTVKDGEASVEVNKDIITKAIENTLKSEQKELSISIAEVKDAELIKAILSVESLDEAKEKGIERISVSSSIAKISITPYALKNSITKDAKKVEINISTVDKEKMPAEVIQKVGDKIVYDFNIYADGEKVTNFTGNKAIQITVPYNLANGEDKNKIAVYYINDKGNLEVVKHCRYDEITGTVTFRTNHLSQYMVKEATVSFKDVNENSWAKQYIYSLAAKEVILGKGEERFDPEGNISRAEFLTLIMRAFEITEDNSETDFSDVDKGEWYYSAVATAKKLGIISGIGNNMFGTNNNITRQEMAAIVYNASRVANIEYKNDKNLPIFSDMANIDEYAKEAVLAMQKSGILEGMGNNTFVPQGNATREQAAKIIYLLFTQK